MNPRHSTRGDGGVSLLLVGALVAVTVGWLAPKVAPSVFDKRTRQAEQSAAASAEVEKAVEKAVAGERKKAAAVSASVKVIGDAAAEAGDAPWAVFIKREAGHIAPLLPAPDYKALYAAEARKRAVLEGKLELADKLYSDDAKKNEKLLTENTQLRAKLAASFAARREVDTDLTESAAYARGKDTVIGCLAAIIVLCVAGWVYAKLTGFGRADIARLANRIREGWDGIEAIDATIPDHMHESIADIAAKLRAKEAAKVAARKAAAGAPANS